MAADNSKFVSIVIPVYQAKDTLRKCVQSCLTQKNLEPSELEILLIDDGSTDGSSELCDQLATEDEHGRIIVRHIVNHGVSHARNLGIDTAKGRFIVFVDSDDFVSEGFVDNMMKRADEETAIVDETMSYSGNQKINGFQYIENAVLNANTHVWGKLFDRKAIVEGNVRFNEKLTIGEDLMFLLDLAVYLGKRRCIRCITEEDYVYTDNPEGAMNKQFKESYLDQLVCWKMAEDKLNTISEHISAYAFVSVAVSQIMTALLVAGKVATQGTDRNREVDKMALSKVRDQIEHALKTRGAFAALPSGYKIKVMIFRLSPELYVKMYARHKGC